MSFDDPELQELARALLSGNNPPTPAQHSGMPMQMPVANALATVNSANALQTQIQQQNMAALLQIQQQQHQHQQILQYQQMQQHQQKISSRRTSISSTHVPGAMSQTPTQNMAIGLHELAGLALPGMTSSMSTQPPATPTPQAISSTQQQRIMIISCLKNFAAGLPSPQQEILIERLKAFQVGQTNNEGFLRSLQERLPAEICEKIMTILKNLVSSARIQHANSGSNAGASATPFAKPGPAASTMKRKNDPTSAAPSSSASTSKKVKSDSAGAMGPPATPSATKQPATSGTTPFATPTGMRMPSNMFSFAPNAALSSFSGASAAAAASNNDSNEAAMDSGSLQDVVKYAGVDLKEESELIMRGGESSQHPFVAKMSSKKDDVPVPANYEDETKKQNFVSSIAQLQNQVKTAVQAAGIKTVQPDVYTVLALAAQDRIRALLEKAVKASRARVEAGRDAWALELLDGPNAVGPDPEHPERSRIGAPKRPLIWLEKHEQAREVASALEIGMSLTEIGQQAVMERGAETALATMSNFLAAAASATPSAAPQQSTSTGGAVSSAATSTPGGVEAAKKLIKKKEELREREDLMARARLANAAALYAAGLNTGAKYSWMTEGAAALASVSSTPGRAGAGGSGTASQEPSRSAIQAAGGFGLPRPEYRKRILSDRRVTLPDLLFAVEQDQSKWGKMRRSKAMLRSYVLRLR